MLFNVVAFSVTDLQNYVQVEIAHTLKVLSLKLYKHIYHVTFAKNSHSRLFGFYLQYLCTTNSP